MAWATHDLCIQAPRPGDLRSGSGVSTRPSLTIRTSASLNAGSSQEYFLRHAMHVRSTPSVYLRAGQFPKRGLGLRGSYGCVWMNINAPTRQTCG